MNWLFYLLMSLSEYSVFKVKPLAITVTTSAVTKNNRGLQMAKLQKNINTNNFFERKMMFITPK